MQTKNWLLFFLFFMVLGCNQSLKSGDVDQNPQPNEQSNDPSDDQLNKKPEFTNPGASVYFRFNQHGYEVKDTKSVLLMTSLNIGGQSLQVLGLAEGLVKASFLIEVDKGSFGEFSHLYEVDLSSLQTPGLYQLVFEQNASSPIRIANGIYSEVASQTLDFFKVQKCGGSEALLHKPCHLLGSIVVGGPSHGKMIDVAGGWHDSGDYIKYSHIAAISAALMMSTYQINPLAFDDENKNGLPDVLDETRHVSDWLLKMWDPANKVLYYQVADGESDHIGWRMPEEDDLRHAPRKVYALPGTAGANVAGKVGAALAMTAQIFGDTTKSYYDPIYSSQCKKAAIDIYAYGKLRPANLVSVNRYYDEHSWKEEMGLAATEIYRLTKKSSYLAEAKNYLSSVQNAWILDWDNIHAFSHFRLALADPNYRSTAVKLLKSDLNSYVNYSKAHKFEAAVDDYYWGSTTHIIGAAITAKWYYILTKQTTFKVLETKQRDYLLGRNPWGVSFVSQIGAKFPTKPHHNISVSKGVQIPGFWTGGPVVPSSWEPFDFPITNNTYSEFNSPEAVYYDDSADYATNEPTGFAAALGFAFAGL